MGSRSRGPALVTVTAVDLGLRDRVAVVTGASRGIGRQIALDLAREGGHVVVCGRDEAALAAVAAEVADLGSGARAVTVAADLVDRGAGDTIVARALEELGRVDILVNNAGGNAPRRLLAVTDDEWQLEFEQNFFSAVRLTRACVPVMLERSWGRVVHISSTYGREPDPYFGPYSASKAALINFSKNLSRAVSAHGVLSNCVVPGVTITELIETNAAGAAEAQGITPEEVMAKLMAKDPVSMQRFGEPAEIAAAVLFLASEQASWITGACLAVDGGTLRFAG